MHHLSKSTCIFLLLLLEIFFIKDAKASTVIYGADTNYRGQEISFLQMQDPFTGKEKVLGTSIVDENGAFKFELDIKETQYLFAYLGIHKVFLFAEVGKSYEVLLPQRIDKVDADRLNPFFQYTEVHLGILNPDKDELNMLIRMFNDSFSPYYAKHNEKVFSDDVEFEQLDNDIEQLDKPFSKSKNAYFNNYRKYKYGLLRFVAYQHKSKSVSDLYFKNQPFLANNPAFVDLFNLVYERYFSYFVRTKNGMLLAPAIRNKSYTQVREVLAFDQVLQPDEHLNMVLLHGLHEEFYDDNYSRSAMLTIMDSLLIVSDNPLIKETAVSIREKVTKLLAGFEPPAFELYDKDSNLVSLDDFKGKFVYLSFCSCFSYTCLNEFVMLQNLHKKHSKYLEIVTVVIDDDVQVMKNFLERSGYQWTFLHFDNNPEIFKKYDVRAFPTYYLIDDEGKLSMSPAPAPAEEFEGRLFKVLRSKGIL